MAIPNQYKDTHKDLVKSLDDGLDIKVPAKLRQIYRPSNDISSPEKQKTGFNGDKDLLKN